MQFGNKEYFGDYMLVITSSLSQAAMAEWLRRWTRNPMGNARAGSNPARSVFFFEN